MCNYITIDNCLMDEFGNNDAYSTLHGLHLEYSNGDHRMVIRLEFRKFCLLFACLQNGQILPSNRLESTQKFMQVGVDVTYMYTNFCGCDLSGFGDTATFKKINGQISFQTMDYSSWSSKI